MCTLTQRGLKRFSRSKTWRRVAKLWNWDISGNLKKVKQGVNFQTEGSAGGSAKTTWTHCVPRYLSFDKSNKCFRACIFRMEQSGNFTHTGEIRMCFKKVFVNKTWSVCSTQCFAGKSRHSTKRGLGLKEICVDGIKEGMYEELTRLVVWKIFEAYFKLFVNSYMFYFTGLFCGLTRWFYSELLIEKAILGFPIVVKLRSVFCEKMYLPWFLWWVGFSARVVQREQTL